MGVESVIMSNLPFWVTIFTLVLVVVYVFWFFFIKNFKKFGTHEIVAISNRHYIDNQKTGEENLKLYRYQKGGNAIINPLTQHYKILPANQIVLEVESKEVRTADDFFISITTVILFSIDSSSESQMEIVFKAFGNLATEKTKIDDFKKGALEILKPLVSSATSTIISRLTYETLIKEEEQFNSSAKDAIEEKFAIMGLIITSISLKDGSIDNQLYIKALKDKKTIEIEKKLAEEKSKYEQFQSDTELEKEKYKLQNTKVLLEQKIKQEEFESDKELEKERYIARQRIEKERQDLENSKILLEEKIEQDRFEFDKKLEEEKHIARQRIEKERYDLENERILQEAKIEKERYDLKNQRIILEQKIDIEQFESEKELEKDKRISRQKIEKERYDLENQKIILKQKIELKEKELEKDNVLEQKRFEYEMNLQKQESDKQQLQQKQEFVISSQNEEQRIQLSKVKQDRIIAEQDIIEKEEDHNIKILRAKEKAKIIVEKEVKELTAEIELKEIESSKAKRDVEAEIELKDIEISQKRNEINSEIEIKQIEVSHKRSDYQLDLENKKVQIKIYDKTGTIEADNKINLRTFLFTDTDKKRQATIEKQKNSHLFLSTIFRENPATVSFFMEKIFKPKATFLDVKKKLTKNKETKDLEIVGDETNTIIKNDIIA
jgi:uncharacterized membrane protein YqiK